MNQFRFPFRAFIVAILATALMVVVRRFVIIPFFDFNAPAMPFILAVMLAAWIGGSKSGFFATVLNAGLLWSALGEEIAFELFSASRQIRLILFIVIGGLISWGKEALDSSRKRLDERRRELEKEMLRREQAEAGLREREERLRLAIESANIGTWDFNPLTGEQKLSSRAKVMFGLSADADVSKIAFRDRVHPGDLVRVNEALHRAFDPRGDGGYETECRLIWPDNTIHWFIAKGQALCEGEKTNRRVTRFIGTVVDITERKQAEDVIHASEIRLRAIMDNTSAIIYLKDSQGRYLMINRRYEELFNVTQQQIVGKTDADIFPHEVMAKIQANDRQVRDTGQPLEFEEVVPHKDGPHTYVSVKFPIIDPDGQCTAVGGVSTDISDRKRIADALESEQEFLRHTLEVQDHERQLIAYEIHDGLMQYMAGALMQVESMRFQDNAKPAIETIESIEGILRRAVAEGRRVMNGIRTPVLDELGVVAAVEHLIQEVPAPVQVEFVRDEGLERLEPKIEEAIYRITQEALTNIHKHSQSKNVRVELGRRGDRVRLEVRDWGVGFRPHHGFKGIHGLRGMTERARIVGGMCQIESTPGAGTRIVVDLPYRTKNC